MIWNIDEKKKKHKRINKNIEISGIQLSLNIKSFKKEIYWNESDTRAYILLINWHKKNLSFDLSIQTLKRQYKFIYFQYLK